MTTDRNRRAVARILADKASHGVYVTTGVGDASAHCNRCGRLVRFAAAEDGGEDFGTNFGLAFDVADAHRDAVNARGRIAA